MDNLATPDSVLRELNEIRSEASKGSDALFQAELKYNKLLLDREVEEAKALLSAQGNVAERSAQAKLVVADSELAEGIAKAELNRVKTKLRLLEQAQMNVQTQARMIELMWKSAGVGER